MRVHYLVSFVFAAFLCTWLALIGSVGAYAQAKKENPVPTSAQSVAAGKKLYDEHCAQCHGEGGKGDGPQAPYANPSPPDLTDGEWKHGSTDADIFTVIQSGVKDTDMQSFKKDIPEAQAWNVVNYVKSLSAKK